MMNIVPIQMMDLPAKDSASKLIKPEQAVIYEQAPVPQADNRLIELCEPSSSASAPSDFKKAVYESNVRNNNALIDNDVNRDAFGNGSRGLDQPQIPMQPMKRDTKKVAESEEVLKRIE